MEQQRIMALLEEAVSAGAVRRTEIHDELRDASVMYTEKYVDPLAAQCQGIWALAHHLYFRIIENRSGFLPSLFPLFAMICGDRNPNVLLFAEEINWDLMEDYSWLSG